MVLVLSPLLFKVILIPALYAIIIFFCLEALPRQKEKGGLIWMIILFSFLFVLLTLAPAFTEEALEAIVWKSAEGLTALMVAVIGLCVLQAVAWIVRKTWSILLGLIGSTKNAVMKHHKAAAAERRRVRVAEMQREGCFARATRQARR